MQEIQVHSIPNVKELNESRLGPYTNERNWKFLSFSHSFWQWAVHASQWLYNHQELTSRSCHHQHLTSTSWSKMAAQVSAAKSTWAIRKRERVKNCSIWGRVLEIGHDASVYILFTKLWSHGWPYPGCSERLIRSLFWKALCWLKPRSS